MSGYAKKGEVLHESVLTGTRSVTGRFAYCCSYTRDNRTEQQLWTGGETDSRNFVSCARATLYLIMLVS